MHKRGVAHRDLKIENILVMKQNTEKNHLHLAIADFDMCKQVSDTEKSEGQSLVGTKYALPPELLHGSYDKIEQKTSVKIRPI